MTGPEFLTATQTGELLGFHRAHVWKLVRQGRLPAPVIVAPPATPGGKAIRRWRRADLENHVQGQAVTS